MSKDEKQICMYCHWFKANLQFGKPLLGEPDCVEEHDLSGDCRLKGPILMWSHEHSETAFPQVYGDCWCGEFEERNT